MSTGPSTTDRSRPTRTAAQALRALVLRLRDFGMSRTRSVYAALGLYLSLSLVLALGAVLVFAEVAEDVLEGDTQTFDDAALGWMRSHRTAWLDRAALELTALGSGVVLATTALLISVFLWHLGRRRHVALVWISAAGALLISKALKAVFARPRPDVGASIEVTSLSFPSGHAMNAIVFYTVLAYVVGRLVGKGRGRTVVHVVGLIVVTMVAWTRMYLGVHYPSDVAAGLAVGYAWAISCCILIDAWPGARPQAPEP